METTTLFANHHIPRITAFPDAKSTLKTIENGSELSYSSFCSGSLSVHQPLLVTDTPASIGMRVPESITVRDVADLVGHSTPVNVMDVEYQEGQPLWMGVGRGVT